MNDREKPLPEANDREMMPREANDRGVTLREADDGDAEAIAALYAHYVRSAPATFEEVPPDTAEISRRIRAVQAAGLPWRVTTDLQGALLGYAYASPYRMRSAYRYTLENSVYIAPHCVGIGLGATLMGEVIDRCAALGYRQMLAVIGDSANTASLALHTRLGFSMVGIHRAVGFKFGRWIDVVHMQLALGEGSQSRPA
jgi:L-amino acid N-acyltransferase YncA